MKKLLVMLTAALLLASCGGGDTKPSSQQATDDFELRFASGRLVILILWDLFAVPGHINKDQSNRFLETVAHVTPEQISRAYLDNALSADNRFKGKQVAISGTVSAISRDAQGNPQLLMPGPLPGTAVRLGYGKDLTDNNAAIAPGRQWYAVCTVNGFADGTVMMDNCQMRPREQQIIAAQQLVTSIVKEKESIAPLIDAIVIGDYYLAKDLPADSLCRRDRTNFAHWPDDCSKNYSELLQKFKTTGDAESFLKKMPEDLRKRFEEGIVISR